MVIFHVPLVQATKCTEVVATAHPDYPPYHWYDGKQMRGASIDINRKIFAELGVPFTVTYAGPWKRVLHAAELGQVDFVMALKKTQARQVFLNFTENPIFPNPFAVFVNRNHHFAFEEWQDLQDRRGGKNAGDRYGEAFDQFLADNLTVEEAATPEINFKKLLAGRIEYFIHSRFSGAAYLQAYPEDGSIVILDKNINDGQIHSGFSRQSSCSQLLPYINKRYKELMEDGSALQFLEDNLLLWQQSVVKQK